MASSGNAYPAIQLNYGYINGLVPKILGDTSIGISAGQCRDFNNVMDMALGLPNIQSQSSPFPIIIDTNKIGVNGLDEGFLNQDMMYSVYVIGDSSYKNPTACIASLQVNYSPKLPIGYDTYRLIGVFSTGEYIIEPMYISGNSNLRIFTYQDPQFLVGEFNQTDSTEVLLGGQIPFDQGGVFVNISMSLTPDTAEDRLKIDSAVYTYYDTGVIGQYSGVPITNRVGLLSLPSVNESNTMAIAARVTSSDDSASIYLESFEFSV